MSSRRGSSFIAALLALACWARSVAAQDGVPPQFFNTFAADLARVDEMAQRYRVVIWHNHPRLQHALAAMKRVNPSVIGIMYRELYCVLANEGALEESVGHYAWISANHPEWFQLDTQGRRVEIPDYPGRWMMNLADPGWQQFWIDETLRDVIESGWDGAMADDALTTIHAHNLPPLAGFPDDASLQQAVTEFLARATEAFHRANKRLIANVASTYFYPGLWDRLLAATDGLVEEHFAGDGWTWGPEVGQRQLEAMGRASAQGKLTLWFTYGEWTDAARMQSSLAAYLVGAGPTSVWSYRPARPEEVERLAWHPSWVVDLGAPIGLAQQTGTIWWRRFERGLAAVNVGASAQSVQANQGPVELQPRQGVVLQTPSATPTPIPSQPASTAPTP